jgi:hypothetical protein
MRIILLLLIIQGCIVSNIIAIPRNDYTDLFIRLSSEHFSRRSGCPSNTAIRLHANGNNQTISVMYPISSFGRRLSANPGSYISCQVIQPVVLQPGYKMAITHVTYYLTQMSTQRLSSRREPLSMHGPSKRSESGFSYYSRFGIDIFETGNHMTTMDHSDFNTGNSRSHQLFHKTVTVPRVVWSRCSTGSHDIFDLVLETHIENNSRASVLANSDTYTLEFKSC